MPGISTGRTHHTMGFAGLNGRAYYNENDAYVAQWLRNLIAAGHIAPGDVDERSIEDVRPDDVRGYTQCHFFAGIGIWSHALRLAGWPDDRPVWTGSCPCQPFSQAGKGTGFDDERHLWPAWFHLVRHCRPVVVFGEQVASPDGLAWIELVQADLEAAHYACVAVDLCAAGVGAPHIRQRIYVVADADGVARRLPEQSARREIAEAAGRSEARELADDARDGRRQRRAIAGGGDTRSDAHEGSRPLHDGAARDVGDADDARLQGRELPAERARERAAGPSGLAGFWRDAEWIHCRDEKLRPVEPGTFPLAHGAPARVGRLRAYGNAIVAPVAEAFIRAYMTHRTNEESKNES